MSDPAGDAAPMKSEKELVILEPALEEFAGGLNEAGTQLLARRFYRWSIALFVKVLETLINQQKFPTVKKNLIQRNLLKYINQIFILNVLTN